ncbi:hypothetical protein Presley_22 [Acinetobacter phage Presley]|uniref:Uncharacterized protein n=1 Tax=Acinetobacter phage Presley TaxID=1406780 RepID=U5PW04_9CAUD|nr:hypothetical protein Presley_22 [Acinetobacter phage Presley]AGY48089.1 hypothetical protein Presley_22 [Acinetobacter phage Presley]
MSEQVTNVCGYILLPEGKYKFNQVAKLLEELGFPTHLCDEVKGLVNHNFWKQITYISYSVANDRVHIQTLPIQQEWKEKIPFTSRGNLYIYADNYEQIIARGNLIGIKPPPYKDPKKYSRDFETRAKQLGR